MKQVLRAAGLLGALAVVAVVTTGVPAAPVLAHAVIAPQTAPRTAPVPTTVTEPPPPAPRLATEVEQAVREVVDGAELGLVVFDRGTGAVLTELNPDQRFHSASVVKLLIALDVLDDAGEDLDQRTHDRLHDMIAASDDGIASAFWVAQGGPELVTRVAERLGLRDTQPPADPGQWGDTLLTAQDVVAVYRHVLDDADARDRELLLTALAGADRIAADGFDQYFGIPDALSGAHWAVKQGWMRSRSEVALHTTGLVGADQRYVIALLTSLPAATSWTRAADAVTAGVGALTAALPKAL
ncbi:serine hydrolase [Allokutzneria oryzae]|uniref:Serine hydrolase n=1 Tax=Allokutzneria oryzae TaxID=1378989 RepID=A0ABV5ZNU8_9PSEU